MEHAPDNDNSDTVRGEARRTLDWELDGPDPEGKVWLSDKGPKVALRMLGSYEDVAAYFADWLAERDFGER